MENVFTCLYRYRKPENFLTSALIGVINSLLTEESISNSRQLTIAFLNNIVGPLMKFSPSDKITIYQNRSVSIGNKIIYPDITISSHTNLAFIEVKDWATTGSSQLEDYCKALNLQKNKNKQLILLCRWTTATPKEKKYIQKETFWYEIHDELHKIRKSIKFQQPATDYLLNSFLDFMEAENMTIKKIGETFNKGTSDLYNLIKMLFEASKEAGIKKGGNWYISETDFGLSFNNQQYFLVIQWTNLHEIVFVVDRSKDRNKNSEKFKWKQLTDRTDDWCSTSRQLSKDFFDIDKQAQINQIIEIVTDLYKTVKY
jgi:hypothetical protein